MSEPPSEGSTWRHLSREWIWISCFAPALFLAGLLFLAGCGYADSDSTSTIDLDSLPVRIAEPVLSVNAIDTLLFAFLYPYSTPLDDGSVLLADARRSQVYQLNRDGTGRIVADNGRGPGEVQFVNNMGITPDGYIYLFDWTNRRITLYNQDLTYEREFLIQAFMDKKEIRWVYPTTEPDLFLGVGTDLSFMEDLDPNLFRVIGLYHLPERSYLDWIRVPSGRVSYTIVDGEMQGFRPVPYVPQTHFSMHPGGGSFYLYWPPSEEITELTLSMDTLRVIPVSLPKEPFSSSEQDSLLDQWNSPDIATLRDMQSQFPEVKSPVDRFLVDDLGRFWLRLTRRSTLQEWLVLDEEATPERIVALPKEAEVTHISSKSIGVREEDMMTFTLYEVID